MSQSSPSSQGAPNTKRPRLLFEISWEVCNMVGGIHTVLATKIRKMQEFYGDNYVVIGPDIGSVAGVFEDDPWDPSLLKALSSLPVGVRMGRWRIPGRPRCLLVRFDSLFEHKDRILARYWEAFGLNSLFGGPDYFEPVLFSHAAGLVIERVFCSALLPSGTECVVQCHEWLACGALLYLKGATPEIGTVFTTHATTLGRTLSSRKWDYEVLARQEKFNPEQLAQEHNVIAKHSMESVAAKVADVFTTVSAITARECEIFLRKKPDLLTLNGLDEATPDPKFMSSQSVAATRARLLQIARLTTGCNYDPGQVTLTLSSGRYEFENKGIDLTLEALARLNEQLLSQGVNSPRVIAFMAFPAGHTGPRHEILQAYQHGAPTSAGAPYLSTHGLSTEKYDPIISRLTLMKLMNGANTPVHVVFVPIYLNGHDPLIPETYYQLLTGVDLTLFPSFYEPWGYTPMESAGAHVPTITSDQAGFGLWASQYGDWDRTGVCVVKRKGVSFEAARDELCDRLYQYLGRNAEGRAKLRAAIAGLIEEGRWAKFGEIYKQAHNEAAAHAWQRTHSATYDRFRAFSQCQLNPPLEGINVAAHTRRFTVLNKTPPELERLWKLIQENLWWGWNLDALELIAELDPDLWLACRQNPWVFLERLSTKALEKASRSKMYLDRMEAVLARYERDMRAKRPPEVAYFCMEFGLSHLVRIYSGGLGILAGDHLKTASDLGIPLCAFGLAYKYGYFRQRISPEGAQEHIDEINDFTQPPFVPVRDNEGNRIRIALPAPGRTIWVQAWKLGVGRVDLYLLDTDLAENSPEDRNISDRLYRGGSEHRLVQEYVLACGGLALIRALGIDPKVYHMNEGHTAFLVLARTAELVRTQGLSPSEALEAVRHSMVFTTHTPVPAGHDQFPTGMVAPYLHLFEKDLGNSLSWELGRGLDRTREVAFSMTALAARGSVHINGVSQIHGDVSRRMFHSMVPQFHFSEVPVLGITNGVHPGTWVAPAMKKLFNEEMGEDWEARLSDSEYWTKLRNVDPAQVWNTHLQLKQNLVKWLRTHLKESWGRRKESPANLSAALANLNERTFIATFARRFAPYKRANLLFRDPARLAKLLSGDTPILLLFAGKAHPSDGLGQSLITQVIEFARRPEFAGKIIFVENYEIDVAQLLVSGSDLWINNPIRPLEASGTSGMKAAMNGCLNLSVADGWWAEVGNGRNGWVVGDASLSESPDYQDTFDSAQMYTLLESEVLPRFRQRSSSGVPTEWVNMMKESIATVMPVFNTERMVTEYSEKFYKPAVDQAETLSQEGFAYLRRLAHSRKRLTDHWAGLGFLDVEVDGLERDQIPMGEQIHLRARLKHPEIRPEDLHVQVVVSNDGQGEFENQPEVKAYSMRCTGFDAGTSESLWGGSIRLTQAGGKNVGVRVIPRACHDTHPVDLTLDLVKWL